MKEEEEEEETKKHVGTLLEPITRGKIKAMNIEHVAGNAPPYLHARKLRAPISPEIEGHLRRKVQRQLIFFLNYYYYNNEKYIYIYF